MAKYDDKVMRNFEKYLALQKSGEMNMVSSQVQSRLGISKDEHMFILNNYSDILNEYNGMKVVDEVIADAKQRVGDVSKDDKEMGFNNVEQAEMETRD